MTQANSSDLWKQAYRNQYGSDADQDMAQHGADVEEWRINWQSGYDAGEEWATNLLAGPASSPAPTDEGSQQPMASQQPMGSSAPTGPRTFADMERTDPSIRQRYEVWRNDVASRGEDATDWDRFRSYLTSQGSPDPGGRPPDDFVGEEWKAEHPEWVARYSSRAA